MALNFLMCYLHLQPANGSYADRVSKLRATLSILALVSAHIPDQVVSHTPLFIMWLHTCLVLQVGKGGCVIRAMLCHVKLSYVFKCW